MLCSFKQSENSFDVKIYNELTILLLSFDFQKGINLEKYYDPGCILILILCFFVYLSNYIVHIQSGICPTFFFQVAQMHCHYM